jgi:hypothetical protein
MSKTSSRNPIDLLDRYLQAVRFWLPNTAKQEDLLAELGEDLRSQIDAREEELGRPLDQAEAAAILKACGNPMVVASRLGPQRYLIGPTLFPIYVFVLKMVLLWVLLPIFIVILAPLNVANAGGDWAKALLSTLGGMWSGAFIAAGTITLVFTILERTQVFARIDCKWNPEKLPPVEKRERKTSFVQTACELVFNLFGLVWLLLIPQHPFMILGPASAILKPAPLWNQFYLPIVLISAFAIVRLALVLARPQWRLWPQISDLMQGVFVLILLRYINAALGHVPSANWYPFVTLADSVKNSGQHIKIAAVVNVSILIALLATWLGVSISVVVRIWELMRLIRKPGNGTRQPASLQLR